MPFGLLKYGFSKTHPAKRHFAVPGELKKSYDVVIIGGGGHGLATAYYLATKHGITDVAVLELREGAFEFVDNYGNKRTGRQRLFPSETVLGGKRVLARVVRPDAGSAGA